MITKANKTTNVSMATKNTWRVVGDEVIKGTASSATYSLKEIVEIPFDISIEIASESAATKPIRDIPSTGDVKNALDGMLLEGNLTSGDVTAIAALYPAWKSGSLMTVGSIVSFSSTLYRVIQGHTSQPDWTPDKVPALFVKCVPKNIIPDWIQPAGAHDAYVAGSKVRFNGSVYESLINANVWSPSVYPAGWKNLG